MSNNILPAGVISRAWSWDLDPATPHGARFVVYTQQEFPRLSPTSFETREKAESFASSTSSRSFVFGPIHCACLACLDKVLG